jgi:hypothetical protein
MKRLLLIAINPLIWIAVFVSGFLVINTSPYTFPFLKYQASLGFLMLSISMVMFGLTTVYWLGSKLYRYYLLRKSQSTNVN